VLNRKDFTDLENWIWRKTIFYARFYRRLLQIHQL